MSARVTSLLLLANLLLPVNATALPDDQYQPIAIDADNAIYDDKQGHSAYNGNVVVSQGSLKLEADKLSVSRDSSFVEAIGSPARFQQQPDPEKPVIEAQANRIQYARENGKIELHGNARLQQGEARITSDHIVYNMADQAFSAGINNTNGDTPAQRVQVIIPAQQRPETTPAP